MDNFEERVSRLERNLVLIKEVLSESTSGITEALEGIQDELIYIKSHLGLTQPAPGIKRK